MRNLFSYLTIFIFISVLTVSCKKAKKDNATPIPENTINVALKANENYSYVVGFGFGVYEKINTQAKHFLISQFDTGLDGKHTYYYTPSLDYTGTDEVVIQLGADNSFTGSYEITGYITFKFNITN